MPGQKKNKGDYETMFGIIITCLDQEI